MTNSVAIYMTDFGEINLDSLDADDLKIISDELIKAAAEKPRTVWERDRLIPWYTKESESADVVLDRAMCRIAEKRFGNAA